jgi:hypothetical protein
MAEPNPRDGSLSPSRDSWGHVGIPAENEIYDFLISTKQDTDAFFEALNLTFRLVNGVLDLMSSFLLDVADPLKVVVQAIISFLDSLIEDFRNAGFYFTYDKDELSEPLQLLKGGYPAYEQRAIKRLVNRQDPTRPAFTQNTKVFALNFFAGVGTDGIERIYKDVILPIKKLLKVFFGEDSQPSTPPPTQVTIGYYRKIAGLTSPANPRVPGQEADGVVVRWKCSSPSSSVPTRVRESLAPPYFLVCVSSMSKNEQLGVGVLRASTPAEFDEYGSPQVVEPKILSTPAPVPAHLYSVMLDSETKYSPTSGSVEKGLIKDLTPTPDFNGSPLLVYGDNDIYTSKIEGQEVSEVYRTFLYDNSSLLATFEDDSEFRMEIPSEALKVGGVLQDSYYVNIYGLEAEEDAVYTTTQHGMKRVLKTKGLVEYTIDVVPEVKTKVKGLTLGSGETTFTFPTNRLNDYYKALRNFYAAFLLCRIGDTAANNKVFGEFTDYGNDIASIYNKMGFSGYSECGKYLYAKADLSRESFASRVLYLVDKAVFNTTTPSSLASVSSMVTAINNFRYDLYEILEKTKEGDDADGYFKTGASGGVHYEGVIYSFSHGRDNGFTWEQQYQDYGLPSARKYISGGLYYQSPYLRLVLTENAVQKVVLDIPGIADVLTNGLGILGVASTEESRGKWLAIRPFYDTDLAGFLSFMDETKLFLKGVVAGLDTIVGEVVKFIQRLQVRLAQLQQFIAKIKAIIDAILNFRLPEGIYATYHISDGTAGLVTSIIGAQNKPPINNGYGTGAMVVAGGLPTTLIDLFKALLGD